MSLYSELDRACDAFSRDTLTICTAAHLGHVLTYKGQPITSLQAYDQACADFDARVASAQARHRRDKLERLRDFDEMHSGLWHQFWAMIRGRA